MKFCHLATMFTAAGSDVDGDGTADGQYCDITAL